jgi:hypothetical protein
MDDIVLDLVPYPEQVLQEQAKLEDHVAQAKSDYAIGTTLQMQGVMRLVIVSTSGKYDEEIKKKFRSETEMAVAAGIKPPTYTYYRRIWEASLKAGIEPVKAYELMKISVKALEVLVSSLYTKLGAEVTPNLQALLYAGNNVGAEEQKIIAAYLAATEDEQEDPEFQELVSDAAMSITNDVVDAAMQAHKDGNVGRRAMASHVSNLVEQDQVIITPCDDNGFPVLATVVHQVTDTDGTPVDHQTYLITITKPGETLDIDDLPYAVLLKVRQRFNLGG